MWHRATFLVEVKGTWFPAPVAKILPPLQWVVSGPPPISDGHRPGKSDPDWTQGKTARELGCTEARMGHAFLQPKCHLVGKSHTSCCKYYAGGGQHMQHFKLAWRLPGLTSLLNLKESIATLDGIWKTNTGAQRPSEGRCACGHINRDTRPTRGTESVPGDNRRSTPPCSSGVALDDSFCPWFPHLKNRGAGRLHSGRRMRHLHLVEGGDWKEGRLRNHASQGPGKTLREASPHRP